MEQLEKNPIKLHYNYSNDSLLSVLLKITDTTLLLLLNWHQLCCFHLVTTTEDSSAF